MTRFPRVPMWLAFVTVSGAGGYALFSRVLAEQAPPAQLPSQATAQTEKQALRQEPVAHAPESMSDELMSEQRNTLMAFYSQEKSYFAERDAYTEVLASIFTPSDWCPDGARLKPLERLLPGEIAGCHFFLWSARRGQGSAAKNLAVLAWCGGSVAAARLGHDRWARRGVDRPEGLQHVSPRAFGSRRWRR